MNSTSSLKPALRERQTGMEKRKASARRIFLESRRLRWFLLIGVTALFVLLLHPKMVVTGPSYRPGDVAERDIKAPQDFFIKDSAATEINIQRAVQEVLTVYDHDTRLLPILAARVETAFAGARSVLESEVAPELLRSVAIYGRAVSPRPDTGLPRQNSDQIRENRDSFSRQIGFDVKEDAFNILTKERFSKDIVAAVNKILTIVLEKGVVSNKAMLLKEEDKGIVLKDLGTKKEQDIADLKQFYDLDQAKSLVRLAGEPLLKEYNYTSRSLIIDLAQQLIQPNITLNKSATEERKIEAADAVKPVLYKIKAGEMLLREGERVTDVQLLKLDALREQMQNDNLVTRSIGVALLVALLLTATVVLYRPNFGRKKSRPKQEPAFRRRRSDRHFDHRSPYRLPVGIHCRKGLFRIGGRLYCLRSAHSLGCDDHLSFPRIRTRSPLCRRYRHFDGDDFSNRFYLIPLFPVKRYDGRLLDSALPRAHGFHQGGSKTRPSQHNPDNSH